MHTIVLSDLHMSEAQRPGPRGPLWMAYKSRDLFVDDDFANLLSYLDETVRGKKDAGHGDGSIELILNGDIFDFDNILSLPDEPERRLGWLARQRGLTSEEWMSCFKMECIIRDHGVWFEALRAFLSKGHRVIFIIGNHDAEVTWPGVQDLISEQLAAPAGMLSFCPSFYISNKDTFVSHGHQYDPLCSVPDMIDPLISIHDRPRVRIPFGDLAVRYMLNGMGYFNPHSSDNYIMTGKEYAVFYFKYMLRTQPLLVWTWFWGAITTLIISLRDHWRPAMRDPLLVDQKVNDIAERSNATPAVVRQLRALDVPSLCSRPLSLLRELWLDRAFLLLAGLIGAWQLILHVNIAFPISLWWVLVPLLLLLPPYMMYAATVKSSAFAEPLLDEPRAQLIADITGCSRVVFGHTHIPEESEIGPVTFFNAGFWSPAFTEPECKNRIGTQSFVWLSPAGSSPDGTTVRAARLLEWAPGAEAPTALNATDRNSPVPAASSQSPNAGAVTSAIMGS